MGFEVSAFIDDIVLLVFGAEPDAEPEPEPDADADADAEPDADAVADADADTVTVADTVALGGANALVVDAEPACFGDDFWPFIIDCRTLQYQASTVRFEKMD